MKIYHYFSNYEDYEMINKIENIIQDRLVITIDCLKSRIKEMPYQEKFERCEAMLG